jgi:hypothetical protein
MTLLAHLRGSPPELEPSTERITRRDRQTSASRPSFLVERPVSRVKRTILVDAHYDQNRDEPTDDRVRFWLRESRTPEVLIDVAAEHPALLKEMVHQRPLLTETLGASRSALKQELDKEQAVEMEADRRYWQPLKRELEAMCREMQKRATE